MQFHHRGLDKFYLDASAVTIGSFDGVHEGHQNIFTQLVEYSRTHSIPSVVITFFPHPILVLREIKEPFYLTLPDEKASILFKLGINHVVTIPFTREISAYSPFKFMDWLNQHLHIKHLVVGEDFALGKDRKGNPESLKEIGQILGYDVDVVCFKENQQNRISSSRIRETLREGNIETANLLLGRQYTIPVQLSIGPENQNQTDEVSIINFLYDSTLLLPAQGLYDAILDVDPTIRFPVMVNPQQNSNKPDLIGFFPMEMRHLLTDKLPTRLVFLSRLTHIPASLIKLQSIYPKISNIIAISNGE